MTIRDLITSAMRTYGAIGITETPGAEEAFNALNQLNGLIETWGLDGLFASTRSLLGGTSVSGQSSYIISPTGDIVGAPPNAISVAKVNDIALAQLSLDDLLAQDQSITGTPVYFAFSRDAGSATLRLWPTTSSAQSITIACKPQYPVVDLDDVISDVFPAGYGPALEYALAALLAVQEGLQRPEIARVANDRYNRIKRLNQPAAPVMDCMGGMFGQERVGNILTRS